MFLNPYRFPRPIIIYPPANQLLSFFCEDVAKVGIYTDGVGGTYNRVMDAYSSECGYVPHVPLILEHGSHVAKQINIFDIPLSLSQGDHIAFSNVIHEVDLQLTGVLP